MYDQVDILKLFDIPTGFLLIGPILEEAYELWMSYDIVHWPIIAVNQRRTKGPRSH